MGSDDVTKSELFGSENLRLTTRLSSALNADMRQLKVHFYPYSHCEG